MSPPPLPVLFVGHGSPLLTIQDNVWTRGWRALGESLPRPSAVLSISAHWYGDGTRLTSNAEPRTIHDFGGFPEELYELRYPAPGDPVLAERVAALLRDWKAEPDPSWGLDHGTWCVLRHVFPEADVPVVQLSLDESLAPEEHLALGRALAPLREEGVLVLGSGNLVHNLRDAFGRLRAGDDTTPLWARELDEELARALTEHDHAFLAAALDTDRGRLGHPTPDHFLPVLVAAGAAGEESPVSFPLDGFDLGSLSMRTVLFG